MANNNCSTGSTALFAGRQAVLSGEADMPAATLTLADDDLLALAQGKASAQALFQRGQLRVDGDARLAHHLSLLAGAL